MKETTMTKYNEFSSIDLMQADLNARRLRAEWLKSAFSGFAKRRAR